MMLFEEKGFVRILLLLLNNQNSIDSKYKLKKLLELNNNSLNECLEIEEFIFIIEGNNAIVK